MITDLVQIRRMGDLKRHENEKLRQHLKAHRYVERKLVQIGQKVEEQIDCMECGNCCKVATTQLMDRDIDRLTKFLGVSRGAFLREYTMADEGEGGLNLKWTKEAGCIFLEGTRCNVYEARPSNCERFPHIDKGEGPIPARMWQFIDRATYCPIVYNSLEAWKDEVGFQRTVPKDRT